LLLHEETWIQLNEANLKATEAATEAATAAIPAAKPVETGSHFGLVVSAALQH
jgi:hypothetical protein